MGDGPMDAAAFYVAEGDRLVATEHTRGPWSPEHQHAGPPAGLIARAVEQVTEMPVARLTIELLRPVPIAALRASARVVRDGRRVQRIEATLSSEDDELARASVVCIRQAELALPELAPHPAPALPGPDASEPTEFPFFRDLPAYHRAMELRFARGTWGTRAAAMWMRMRIPLVAGEEPTPLQRVMVAADSGNGITNVLDTECWLFMNPDLSVHLHRHPAGEWVCLDAVASPEPTGRGLADTQLRDERGPIGRSLQTLLIEAR